MRFNEKFKDNPEHTSQSYNIHAYSLVKAQEVSDLIRVSNQFIYTFLRKSGESFKDSGATVLLPSLYNHYDQFYTSFLTRAKGLTGIPQDMKDNLKTILQYEYMFSKMVDLEEASEDLSNLIELLTLTEDPDILVLLIRTIAEKIHDSDYTQDWKKQDLQWQIKLLRFMNIFFDFFNQVTFDVLLHDFAVEYKRSIEKRALRSLFGKVESLVLIHKEFITFKNILQRVLNAGENLEENSLTELNTEFRKANGHGKDSKPEAYEISAMLSLLSLANSYSSKRDNKLFNLLLVTERFRVSFNSMESCIPLAKIKQRDQKWPQIAFQCLELLEKKGESQEIPLEYLCLLQDIVPIYKFLLVKSRVSGQIYSICALQAILGLAPKLANQKPFCMRVDSLLDETLIEFMLLLKKSTFVSYDKHIQDIGQNLTKCLLDPTLTHLIGGLALREVASFCSEILSSDQRFTSFLLQQTDCNALFQTHLPQLFEKVNAETPANVRSLHSILKYVTEMLSANSNFESEESKKFFDELKDTRFIKTLPDFLLQPGFQQVLKHSPEIYVQILDFVLAFDNKQNDLFNDERYVKLILQGSKVLQADKNLAAEVVTRSIFGLFDKIYERESLRRFPSIDEAVEDLLISFFSISALNGVSVDELEKHFTLSIKSEDYSENQRKIKAITKVLEIYHSKIETAFKNIQGPEASTSSSGLLGLEALATEIVIGPLRLVQIMIESLYKRHDVATREILDQCKSFLPLVLNILVSPIMMFAPQGFLLAHKKTDHIIDRVQYFIFLSNYLDVNYFTRVVDELKAITSSWPSAAQLKLSSTAHYLTSTSDTSEALIRQFVFSKEEYQFFNFVTLTSAFRDHLYKTQGNDLKLTHLQKDKHWAETLKHYEELLPTFIDLVIAFVMNIYTALATESVQDADSSSKHGVYEKWYGYLQLVWKGLASLSVFSDSEEVYDTTIKIIFQHLLGASQTVGLPPVVLHHLIANACGIPKIAASLKEDIVKVQDEGKTLAGASFFKRTNLNCLANKIEKLDAVLLIGSHVKTFTQDESMEHFDHAILDIESFYQFLSQNDAVYLEFRKTLDYIEELSNLKNKIYSKEQISFISNIQKYLNNIILKQLRKVAPKKEKADFEWSVASKEIELFLADITAKSEESLKASSESSRLLETLSARYLEMSEKNEGLLDWTKLNSLDYPINETILSQALKAFILLSRAIPFKEEIAKALKKEKKDTFSEEYTKLFEKIMHDIRAYLSYTFLQGKTHAQFEKEVISSMRDLVYSNQNNQEFRVIFSQESFLKSIWLLIYNLILISREAANEVIESGLLEALLKKEYTTSVTWETSSFALLIFDIYMSSSLPAKELIELHLKIHFTLKSNQQQNLKELLDSDFLEFAIKSVNQEDLSDVLTNHFKVSFDNDQDPTCDIQSEKASILQSSSIENAGVLDCAIKSLSKTVKKVLDVLINALVANYCSVVAHRESEDYVQSGTKRLTTELLYQLLFIVSKYPHLIPHVFMKEIQTSIIRAEQLPEFYPYTKFQNQDTVLFLDVLLRVVIKQDTAYALPLLDFRRSCGLIAEIVKEGENTRVIDLNHVLQDKFIQLINELIEEELASGRVGGSYSSIETITTAMLYIPFYGAQDIGISNLQFAKSFKTTLSKLLDWLLAMDKKSFDNEAVFSNISLVSDTLTLQANLLNEGEFTPYRDENYLKLLKELEEFKDIGKEDDTVLGHRKIFDNFADKLRNTHNANDRAVEIEGQSEELSKRAKGRLYSVLQDRAHEMGLGFSGFYPENALEHGFTAEKLTLASDAQKSYHENMEGFSFYFLRNPERDTLLQFELPKKLQNPKLSISIKNLPHIQDQFAIKFDSAAFLNKLKERKLSKPPSPQKQDAEENKEQAQEKEESKVPETVEEEEVIPPSQLFEKVMEAAQSEPERYSELLTKILDGNLFEPINSGAITDPVEAKRLVIDVVESLSVEADVKQELIQKVFGSPKEEKARDNEEEESKVPETVEEEQVIPLSQLFERVMEAAQSEPERYSELLTKILDENLFEPINSGTITDPAEAKKLVGDVVESCSVSADVKQDFIKKVFGSPKKEKSGENEEESKAQEDDFLPSQAFDKVMEVVSKYPDKYNEFVNKALDEGLFDQLNGMVDAKEAKEVIKNAAERYIGSSSLREEFLDKLFAKLSKKNTFQNEEAETFLMPKEIFDKYIKSSLGALKKRKLNVTDVKKHWFKKLGDVKRQVKFKIESVLLHLRRSLLTKSQIDKLNSQEIEEIADIKDPVELEYFIKAFYDQAPEYLDETVKERATQAKRTIESIEEFIPQDDDNSRLEHFLERYMSYLEEAKARRENQEGEEEKKDSSEQVIPGTKTELVSSIQSDSHARRSNGGSAIPSITSLQGRPPPKFVLTNHVRFCNEDINYDELKPGKRQFAKEDEKANEKITPEMLEKFTTYLCCTDKQIEGLVEFLYLDYLGAETWKENNDLAKLFLNVCKNPLNEIKLVDTILFLLFHPQIYQENQQSTEFPLKMASDSSLLGLSSPQKVYATFLQNAVYLLKFLIQSQSLRFVYVPMQSIKSFTIKSIHNLKTKYRFNEKNDDISCLFDLILGLSFVPEIKKDKKLMGLIESLFRVILDSVQTLHNKNYSLTVTARHIEFLMTTYGLDEVVKTFEGSPRLFMNIIPSIFEVVLAHLKKDTEKANQISAKLKEIEKVPEDQRDNLLNAIEINVEFADIIKSVYTTVETFFNYLFRSTYLFWNMKEYNDLVDKETFKVIENSLRNIRRELEQEELQLFMLSIYEILDVYARIVGKQNFTYESIQSKTGIVKLVEFAVYLYSIIEMKQRLDQEIAEDDGDAPMPKLSKMVSKDYGEGPQKMSRTFTYIRREKNFDFDVIFTNFGLKYNKILSSMCAARENEPISGLVLLLCERYPFLLNNDTQRTFVKKMYREYFYKGEGPSRRDITITRSRIIETLAERLEGLDRAELARPLRISFENESGIDEGGLTRELYTTLAHELFDPDKGLFRLSGNKLAIQPRPDSAVIPNHLKLFELAGIAIAKAIISDVIVDCNFTKSFLKHILGRKIAIADLSDFDAELAKNAQWTLENEVEGLCLTFSYDTQILGENVTKELIEGGADIEVDDYNKKDYVMKLCEALMTKEINLQLEYFIKGFRAILPSRFLSHLSPTDLALIISGTPTIDLEDMKKNCRFENFEETSDLAKWIWEVMSEFTQEELASFLYFISGSNKVPAGGFQNRQVVFKMLDHLNPEQLPVAHTCFYTLDLPNYVSKDKVREKLLLSLYEGKEGFFIA